jgi:hypothetical protein
MRLPLDRALLCIQLIVEGNSVRSTERITGVHRDTILAAGLRITFGYWLNCWEQHSVRTLPNSFKRDVYCQKTGDDSLLLSVVFAACMWAALRSSTLFTIRMNVSCQVPELLLPRDRHIVGTQHWGEPFG